MHIPSRHHSCQLLSPELTHWRRAYVASQDNRSVVGCLFFSGEEMTHMPGKSFHAETRLKYTCPAAHVCRKKNPRWGLVTVRIQRKRTLAPERKFIHQDCCFFSYVVSVLACITTSFTAPSLNPHRSDLGFIPSVKRVHKPQAQILSSQSGDIRIHTASLVNMFHSPQSWDIFPAFPLIPPSPRLYF